MFVFLVVIACLVLWGICAGTGFAICRLLDANPKLYFNKDDYDIFNIFLAPIAAVAFLTYWIILKCSKEEEE